MSLWDFGYLVIKKDFFLVIHKILGEGGELVELSTVGEFFLIRMWICGIVIGMERCV